MLKVERKNFDIIVEVWDNGNRWAINFDLINKYNDEVEYKFGNGITGHVCYDTYCKYTNPIFFIDDDEEYCRRASIIRLADVFYEIADCIDAIEPLYTMEFAGMVGDYLTNKIPDISNIQKWREEYE